MPNLLGLTLLNRYRVDAYVDSGSMGSVYRVWDLQRSAPLAMKVLHAELADDPATFRRFKREANALKKLAHPNIVPFYGLYQTEDATFLLEAFIDGSTLKKVLQNAGGQLSTPQALAYLQPVCAALGFAHANGVVHCDVKPANVMVAHTGAVYLADFGIARHADSTTTTLVGAGSPAYMAPEQIRGEVLSPAADVYALGVMLFELLSGRRPFLGETEASGSPGTDSAAERVRTAHLTQPPPDPCDFNPQIPRALAAVVLRALEKEPGRRFASAPALFQAACSAAGVDPGRGPERVVLPEQSPPAPPQPPPQQRRPRSAMAWLVMAVGVVVVIILGFAILGSGRGGGEPARTSPVITQPVSVAADTLIPTISNPPASSVVTQPPPAPLPSLTYTPGLQITGTSTASSVDSKRLPACTAIGETWVSPIDGMRLVCVPAGNFYHTSKNTPVYLNAFWADQNEVTNAMYAGCVQAGKCSPPRVGESNEPIDYYGQSGGGAFPVTRLDWSQASQYCTWAGRRLLTDQEWQKTARGTDQRIYPWGDTPIDCRRANFWGCIKSYAAVDAYPNGASLVGALNMSGNVYEWVDAACPDGQVIVGGSWNDPPEKVVVYEAACRLANAQSSKLGFRCGY